MSEVRHPVNALSTDSGEPEEGLEGSERRHEAIGTFDRRPADAEEDEGTLDVVVGAQTTPSLDRERPAAHYRIACRNMGGIQI